MESVESEEDVEVASIHGVFGMSPETCQNDKKWLGQYSTNLRQLEGFLRVVRDHGN